MYKYLKKDMNFNKNKEHDKSTGIPVHMKRYIENQTGLSFDDVRVYYNSNQPRQFKALGYTQGKNIFLRQGQEKHLMHELCHVAQQKKGLVKPTSFIENYAINDNTKLEKQAELCERQYKSEMPIQMLRDEVAQVKDINSPTYQSDYGVIQMFDPTKPNTWKRPGFYDKIKEKLWDRQVGLYYQDMNYPDNITGKSETTIMTLCPICRGPLDYQGATIDHITNWREYAQKIWRVSTEDDLKKAYNDINNLMLVHASCNSSKGDSEISQFGALGHIPNRRTTWGTTSELQEMGKRVEETIREITNYYNGDNKSRRNIQELKQLYYIYRITGETTNLDRKLSSLRKRFFKCKRRILRSRGRKKSCAYEK